MTNKEGISEEGEAACESRLVALLAVHFVSQILDEAYVIANHVTETGQPWQYLERKNWRSGHLEDVEEVDVPNCDSKEEDNGEEDAVTNVVATSTPHKIVKSDDDITNVINETSFIGQGDEDTDMRQTELTKSTSMFINHLFDMSEVEQIIICDDTEIMQSDSNDLITEAMTKIMESYVNTALGIAFGQKTPPEDSVPGEKTPSSENSGYSFLADAYTSELGNDEAFCMDAEAPNDNKDFGEKSEITEIVEAIEEVKEDTIKRDDVAFYENTYLTLNRDYDQCSDDDGNPILQDTKGMSLHEVELIAMHTSEENSLHAEEESPQVQQPKNTELTAASAVSASASGSRKSGLVQRCRSQGARLLACLRGWWRRKTPGKRKEARVPGSVRGLCPLSPDARRRASSLLFQRSLCSSPPAAQHVLWKFNTVSEALVNSSRWKDYTFDANPDECGEY